MLTVFSKKILATGVVVVLLIGGVVIWYWLTPDEIVPIPVQEAPATTTKPLARPTTIEPVIAIIGTSVEGRSITSYTYGDGATNLLFIGGIHGGYEWNSVLLAYQFMDYLAVNPGVLPADISVTIVPSANPDGLFAVIKKAGRFTLADTPPVADTTGLGRFNANGVDINRNFDCKWQATSTWRTKTVDAGTVAFSEPESLAIRNVVQIKKPTAVVFWHSQANAVYASECEAGILPDTLALTKAYALSAGYTPVLTFDAYPITGDAEGWLASIGIPAITVELSTHERIEWEKNWLGIKALFAYYKNSGE